MTKRDITFITVLLAILVVFFSPILFTLRSYYIRDITYIFHPWKTLVAEMLQRGELPLWNPYVYSGMPLMANMQSAVWYPLSLIFNCFPFPAALTASTLLHISIAGLGAYLFARAQHLRSSAAFAMAILFSLNGFIITKIEFLSHIGVDVWVFLLLLLRHKPLLLGMGMALSFFTFHQNFLFQIGIIILVLILEGIIDKKYRALNVRTILGAGVLALLISAIQLLPSGELLSYSQRMASGVGDAIAMLHSLHWRDSMGFISPYLIKPSVSLVTGEVFQWDTTMYIGVFGVLMAVFGLRSVHKGRVMVIAGGSMAVIGVLFAMGDSLPIYPFLYRTIPLLSLIRYPVQYLYFAIVGITILAGYGVARVRYPYSLIMGMGIALELCFIGFNVLPTAPYSYFYQKPALVRYLQDNDPEGRFILSPGTEKNRLMRGDSIMEGWQQSREHLYSLCAAPYHIYSAYGMGEPLTLTQLEKNISKLYAQPTPQRAAPLLNAYGIGYMVAARPFANEEGFTRHGIGPILYELKQKALPYEIDNGETTDITITRRAPTKVIIEARTGAKGLFYWKEMYYPGWHTVTEGKKLASNSNDYGWRCWMMSDKPDSRYVHYYDSLVIRTGMVITLLTIMLIAGYGVKQLMIFITRYCTSDQNVS